MAASRGAVSSIFLYRVISWSTTSAPPDDPSSEESKRMCTATVTFVPSGRPMQSSAGSGSRRLPRATATGELDDESLPTNAPALLRAASRPVRHEL